HEIAAHWTFVEWTRLRSRALRDEAGRLECLRIEELALHSLGNAIALRPLSSPLHDRMASYHRAFRGLSLELLRASNGRDSMAEGRAKDHLRLALLSAERAVELYPTYPPIRYSLGRLLDEDGRGPEAERQYREALRLDEGVAREQWSTDRMRLPLLARARSWVRLGDRTRAVALVASGPLPSADEQAAEWDDLMGAVIREARKSTMGPVQPRGNQ
ncbi:MAG TPA: hypothetical protein VEN81_15685, partial [Planctomycetota bacterium]|nr:hypothetical protein [Planctomycetota bacterium]